MEQGNLFYQTEEHYDFISHIAHGLVDNEINGEEYLQILNVYSQLMSPEQFEEFSRLVTEEAVRYSTQSQ